MENNKIEKVNIKKLIETLMYLYNTGADYVDIVGVQDEQEGDSACLSIRQEYLCSEDEREIISIINPLHEDNKGDMDDEDYFNKIIS